MGVGGGGTSLMLVLPLVSLEIPVLVLGWVEVAPVTESAALEVGCETVVVV
jgi:hypothetical protein